MRNPPLLAGTLLAAFAAGPAATAADVLPSAFHPQVPGSGSQASETSLESALRSIEIPSGVRFRIAPELARDTIRVRVGSTVWPEVIREMLRGYNYLAIQDESRRLTEVIVTGRNGDGFAPVASEALPPAAGELFSYRVPAPPVPAAYRSYAPGSVFPIDIPIEQLRAMEKGTRVSVNLPDGHYSLMHDNAWHHDNGDLTWVGYVEGTQGLYRAFLTLGRSSLAGRILTPGGLYKLETVSLQNWLIDINASGLQRGTLEGDGRIPDGRRSSDSTGPAEGPADTAADRIQNQRERTYSSRAALAGDGRAVIDVLLFYTSGLQSPDLPTQLNHLITLANQAYVDSRVQAVLRLAATRKTAYPNGGDNYKALKTLTFFKGVFRNIPRQRKKMGADAVLLIRPLKSRSQGGNCGISWVNGGEGNELLAELAFGVVGYGTADGYYCSDYTLAHEVGHILGASHDREHSTAAGRFSYSYGHGFQGRFGTVMSYYDPEVGLFSNPDLAQCDGMACGIPRGDPQEADNAFTFNQTAKVVSGFVNPVPIPMAK